MAMSGEVLGRLWEFSMAADNRVVPATLPLGARQIAVTCRSIRVLW
jgi:hypothetical protein